MDTFFLMLKNVLLFVLLAVPGYLLVKGKVLKSEQSSGFSQLLSMVAVPFMIVSGTINLPLSKNTLLELLFTVVLGTALIFIFYFLSFLFVGKLNDADEGIAKKKKSMIRFCQVFANNGFLGMPLAAALFGMSSRICSYLTILVVINNVVLYTLGFYMVSFERKNMRLKTVLLNPVVLGFVVGLILNITGVCKVIPEIDTYVGHLKNLVTPIAMLILGMKMGDLNLSTLFKCKKLYLVSLVKLIVFPVVTVALAYPLTVLLKKDTVSIVLAMFMSFAMPTAGLASAFADSVNGDTEGAAIYTFGTTILSVVTIPVLFWILTAIL